MEPRKNIKIALDVEVIVPEGADAFECLIKQIEEDGIRQYINADNATSIKDVTYLYWWNSLCCKELFPICGKPDEGEELNDYIERCDEWWDNLSVDKQKEIYEMFNK